jgi:hypothetical protein
VRFPGGRPELRSSYQLAFLVARETLVFLFVVIFVCFLQIVTTRSGKAIFDNVLVWVWMIELILLVASELKDSL